MGRYEQWGGVMRARERLVVVRGARGWLVGGEGTG